MRLIPVTLPPGRAKLATSPLPNGSPDDVMTIGIVLVARLAASGPSVPLATITSTFKRTSSSAMRASRAASFLAYLISSEALFPSIQPNCLRASINTASMGTALAGLKYPILRTRSSCCARAASGHGAAPPSKESRACSRPRRPEKHSCATRSIASPSTSRPNTHHGLTKSRFGFPSWRESFSVAAISPAKTPCAGRSSNSSLISTRPWPSPSAGPWKQNLSPVRAK